MSRIEKHKNHIFKKLGTSYQINSINKIKKMPKGINYVTWSIGWEVETDYSYEISCQNQNGIPVKIFCQIVTFLSLFIIQSLFFEVKEDKHIRINP